MVSTTVTQLTYCFNNIIVTVNLCRLCRFIHVFTPYLEPVDSVLQSRITVLHQRLFVASSWESLFLQRCVCLCVLFWRKPEQCSFLCFPSLVCLGSPGQQVHTRARGLLFSVVFCFLFLFLQVFLKFLTNDLHFYYFFLFNHQPQNYFRSDQKIF